MVFVMILFQLTILCFTCIGWGYWVWLLCGFKKSSQGPDWLLSMLCGFCACILALQNLVYWGLRVKWTAWFAVVVAAAGCFQFVRRWLKERGPSIDRKKDPWITVVVFLAIFAFQGVGLFRQGPQDYYGYAHNDQVNYTLLSQFLVEEPFSSELKDVKLKPWMVKGIDIKNMRIGQSVAQGYLGVVSLTDSKSAYGVLSIFFIALLSILMFALARGLGLSLSGAFLTGIWTGLLPALTKMHLHGFISQTSILFIFPSIALLFATIRSLRPLFILSIFFLSWLLSTYTEVYVIGAAIAACFCLFLLTGPVWVRIMFAVGTIISSLLINPLYTVKFFTFLQTQYQVASNPLVLSDLVPYSGTWRGWAEIFLQINFLRESLSGRMEIWAGFFLLFLCAIGLLSNQSNRLRICAASLLPPISVLVVLWMHSTLPKYPFSKILDTFSPFWVLLIVLGTSSCSWWIGKRILTFLPSDRKEGQNEMQILMVLILVPFIALSGYASWIYIYNVVQNHGILQSVNTPRLREIYRELEKSKGRYLINEEHCITNAWLAYHARKSDVYFESNKITDRPVPLDQFAFRRIPDNPVGVKLVNANGIKDIDSYQGLPEFLVRNLQGIDQQGLLVWYWVGDSMEIEFVRFNSVQSQEHYRLMMTVMSGPAHPDSHRKVSLISPDGAQQIREFDSMERLSFDISLPAGRTNYKFKVLSPTEHINKSPVDPRKHMVRVQEVDLLSLK